MPITLNGDSGITTPTYGGADASEYIVPVTSFKNRIINGAMQIDQRNAGASVTPAVSGVFLTDRWQTQISQASKLAFQQNRGAVTPPVGFTNYLGVATASAVSIGAADFFTLIQTVEGFNVADLGWGTANAQAVTLSFRVYSSLTGTFGGSIYNSAFNRSYPFTYSVASANTWTTVTVNIAGDTSGTWVTNNGIGLGVSFGLGAGSTYSGTAGAWAGSGLFSATGATSVVGTNGATFYITGVQLEKGSTATSFDYRPYGTELALCQRYYWKIAGENSDFPAVATGFSQSSTGARTYVKHPVSMRTYPTFSFGGTLTIDNAGSGTVTSISGAYEGLDTSMLDFAASGGGLTAGRGCVVYCSPTPDNFLQASAEL
jgi:hypothetical protein